MTADDEFLDRLAELDEALAAGHTPLHAASTVVPTLQRRLDRGFVALRALNNLRPATVIPSETSLADTPAMFGRFQILKELGRGGFGVVFLAYDPKLNRKIALKAPHAHILMNDELRSRFCREALAAAKLDHPNLVPVYEVDEAGPICFMATAYVAGPTLADWLSRRPAISSADAASFVATLADAVAHAHERGVVHRDLKPANVLLQKTESASGPGDDHDRPLSDFVPRITDFGLAKLIDEPSAMTQSRATLGTPAYMAPEQARGRNSDVGPAADIHALGAILYELLTGRPPFRGESDLDTLQLVGSAEPTPPRRWRANLPRDLDTICLKCLEKSPERRYGRARELAEDLHRFCDGRPILARPVGPIGRLNRLVRRKPLVAALSAALVAAIVFGAAGIIREYNRANRERSDAVVARDRTGRLLGQAQNSLGEMIEVGQQLTHGSGTAREGTEILAVARRYHRGLLDEDPGNTAIRSQAVTICRRLGLLTFERGDWQTSDEAWAEAAQHAERLMTESDRTDHRASYVDLMNGWAEQLMVRNQFDRLVEVTGRAEPIARALAAEQPHDITTAYGLVCNQCWRATGLRKVGGWPEAASALHEALTSVRLHGQPFRAQFTVGVELNCLNWLSEGYVAARQYREAEDYARQSVAIARAVVADRPADADLQMKLGGSLSALGRVLFATSQWQGAVDAQRESNRIFAAHPERMALAGNSFQAYQRGANVIAGALSKLGRLDEAFADVQFAVRLPLPATYRAGRSNPTPPELFENYVRLFDILIARGETEEARRVHAEAIKRLPAGAENDPLLNRWVQQLGQRAAQR